MGAQSSKPSPPGELKLYYFDIPGKAEPIRLACFYAGLELEDYRFGSRDEFTKMKESGELPFGQVPMLRIGTASDAYKHPTSVLATPESFSYLAQSNAILRYIGRRAGPSAGLYPDDALSAARVDAALDQESDLTKGLGVAKYAERFGFSNETVLTDANKLIVRRALCDDVCPRHLGFFEAMLAASATGWIAGTAGPSIADFVLAPALKGLPASLDKVCMDAPSIAGELLAPFPQVCAYIERFYALPKIVEYYAARA